MLNHWKVFCNADQEGLGFQMVEEVVNPAAGPSFADLSQVQGLVFGSQRFLEWDVLLRTYDPFDRFRGVSGASAVSWFGSKQKPQGS